MMSSVQLSADSSICTTKLYRNENFLRQKYTVEGLSARQIAVLISCSHAAVNRALQRFGIVRVKQQSGWVEYGYKMSAGKRVPHIRQQNILARVSRWRSAEWSFDRIATALNCARVRTPSGNGKWYAATIRRIVDRQNRKHR